jgi:putative ABC transport system permease protein
MDTLFQDVRYAIRQLVRSPGFTFVAVLTLALGLGANTAIFSVVHGILLRPLPYPEPDRLTMVWLNNPGQGIDKDIASFPLFADWRQQARSFERIVAYTGGGYTLTGRGEPEQLRGARVAAGFFPMLGVPAAHGRGLLDEENLPGHEKVVVLGHGLWQRRFGGDPAVLGQTVSLGGSLHTVVGVMPRGFQFPEQAELWTPLAPVGPFEEFLASRGSLWLSVTARLRPGVSLAAAQAEMDTVAAAINKAYPDGSQYGVKLEPLHQTVSGDVRPALLLLLGAVGLVLLIACANVANLLLARASSRRREIAIRSALGAGRGRVIRQLLTESLLLGITGGVLGVILARVGVEAFVAANPTALPRLETVAVDGTILLFALAASTLTGLVFGLVPALQTFREAVSEQLGDATRGSSEGGRGPRIRATFVVAETGLALMLLVGAGLLVRSFVRILDLDPGLDAGQVTTVRLTLPEARYPEPDQIHAFYDRLLTDLRALPGVRSAGGASSLLLSRLPNSGTLRVQGMPAPPPGTPEEPVTNDSVTTGFFETLHVPLKSGRLFEARDAHPGNELRARPVPTVAVVNEALVRRFFAGQDPLGQRITFGNPTNPQVTWSEIVGVVGDVRRSGLDQEPRAEAYFYQGQAPDNGLHLVLRADGDLYAVARAAQKAVWAIDPDQPVASMRPLEDLLRGTVAERRLSMGLLAAFGVLALLLAAIGIYGVMAFSTAQRTRELGIRLALGAEPRDVLRLILLGGVKVSALGVGLGVVGALAASRALSSMLFGISPADPLTFALVVGLLAGASLLACYIPARRATRVDPVVALRQE